MCLCLVLGRTNIRIFVCVGRIQQVGRTFGWSNQRLTKDSYSTSHSIHENIIKNDSLLEFDQWTFYRKKMNSRLEKYFLHSGVAVRVINRLITCVGRTLISVRFCGSWSDSKMQHCGISCTLRFECLTCSMLTSEK